MPRIPLLAKIIIAIAAGIGAGMIFPDWLARSFATFNALFSALLAFVIPLLIVGFVAPAISDIGRRAGGMLLATVAVAYGMTFCSGLLAYFTADLTFPSLIDADSYMLRSGTAEAAGPAPYFTIAVDPLMSVTSALVLAFLLGFGGAVIESAAALRRGLADFRDVIRLVITRLIIPLLPDRKSVV